MAILHDRTSFIQWRAKIYILEAFQPMQDDFSKLNDTILQTLAHAYILISYICLVSFMYAISK